MHYLVTGGAGFIGSHLTQRLLTQGHRVTVLDDLSTGKREQVTGGAALVVGNITTPGIFDGLLQDVDGCFHLAAIASVQRSEEEWLRTHAVNLGGTIALFDAIARRRKPLPVVYASSAAVYGDSSDRPLKETSPCLPRSAYGADKYSCELQARVAHIIHGIPSVGLRFFNVYGPRQDPASPYSGVITIFTSLMKRHQPVTIHGDGEQSRDFIYVDDVVRGIGAAMQLLERDPSGCHVCNLGTGIETSVNSIAENILGLTQSRSTITHGPARGGDPRSSCADPAKARALLGFTAELSLGEGLARMQESL